MDSVLTIVCAIIVVVAWVLYRLTNTYRYSGRTRRYVGWFRFTNIRY